MPPVIRVSHASQPNFLPRIKKKRANGEAPVGVCARIIAKCISVIEAKCRRHINTRVYFSLHNVD